MLVPSGKLKASIGACWLSAKVLDENSGFYTIRTSWVRGKGAIPVTESGWAQPKRVGECIGTFSCLVLKNSKT